MFAYYYSFICFPWWLQKQFMRRGGGEKGAGVEEKTLDLMFVNVKFKYASILRVEHGAYLYHQQ